MKKSFIHETFCHKVNFEKAAKLDMFSPDGDDQKFTIDSFYMRFKFVILFLV